jgi:hypothetical protein
MPGVTGRDFFMCGGIWLIERERERGDLCDLIVNKKYLRSKLFYLLWRRTGPGFPRTVPGL